MAEITVYEKPTCTTCKNLMALLQERGVDFETVEYHVLGITEGEIRLGSGRAPTLDDPEVTVLRRN